MKIIYSKKACVLLLMLFATLYSTDICIAQLSQVVSESSIYSPPSPNASALLRYANVPVDEHTGIPSVILPIDQLSGRQLSVPITLSYHAAGNKVQDIASNVGLGFVLNAGGVITRVMRGLPDESTQGYQYNGHRVNSGTLDSVYLNATINSKIDAEPDMFYFNFLGHTGKLVVDTNGNPQYLPDQGIRVISHPIHNNPDSVHNAWILKDLNGTTYEFGTDTSSQELTIVNMVGQPISKAITYTSSWYLTKVITPDGKEMVNFSYSSGPNLSYDQYRNITTYVIQDDNTDTRTGIFSGKVRHTDSYSAIDTQKIDVSTIIQVLNPKYISAIQNDMGSITFSYNSRLDLVGGQSLNQIKVYNIDDSATPLKTYTFNESYFLSPNPNSPTDPNSKRLRLNCVTFQGRSAETKQLFVFSYNEQTLLPPRNSDEFDHWGYYTTLNKRAGYPPVNLTVDKYGNYVDGFDERAPDSVRVQACILTRVRNVNGGYTNFYYTIDKYNSNGTTTIGGGLRIRMIIENDSLGQVVPIITQYNYSADDGTSSGMIYNPKPYYIQGITNYQAGTVVKPIPSLLSYVANTYKNPITIISTGAEVALYAAGATSGVGLLVDVGISVLVPAVVDAFQFLFHRTHHYTTYSPPFSLSSTPLNNLFDINGASVTYSEVQVLNADGGRTVNYFTSEQDYPDSSSSGVLNCLAKYVKTIYGNTGSYPPSTSFDFERGLLKASLSYDNYNNLVSMVANFYHLSNRVSTVYGQSSSVSGYASLPNNAFQVITYNVGIYKEIAQNIQLTQSITRLFDQDHSGNAITIQHTYTWQPSYPTLMHTESTLRSDGQTLTNYLTYPMEYAPGTTFLDDMVRHYMLATPIESVSTLQNGTAFSIIGGTVSRYKPGGLGLLDTAFSVSASNLIPLANFKFSNQLPGENNGSYQSYKIDKSYIAKAFFQSYDSKNNLIQSQILGEPSSSSIWGYNQDVPIAKISNATIGQVAYTSFETNDQRYWTFASTGRDSSGLAKTGKVRYQLSSGAVSTATSLPSGTYILSLWTQGAKPTIGGITADVTIVNGESDNHSWNFYMDRVTVAGGTNITLTGSGFIDELRLYPQGAHMSTMSISPQIGTTSTCSQDDKVNTYEYDALLRSKTVRDDQYNILKEYSYSNVPSVPCVDIPDVWKGTNPICVTDQSNIIPDTLNYTATAVNSYGNIICNFTRKASESSYLAKINYTVSFSDNTTYTSSILIQSGDLSTLMGLPLTGKSAESVSGIGIDTIINLSNDYGLKYQLYLTRQRVRDGFTETNTYTGGVGPYIAPVQSATGCSISFTSRQQTGFYKNNCSVGVGSYVPYVVAAGAATDTTQAGADSIAKQIGQTYANTHGNCSSVDTSFVGINPYCTTGTPDTGTPSLSSYSISITNIPQFFMFLATLTRTSAEAIHDATVSYKLQFNDGSTATYTVAMYKNQQVILFSPPLGGYGPNNVTSISITNVVYSALNRLAYTNRARLLNGVLDGYQEANTAGTYYLAPLADPAACNTWYYNTAQTGFYKNNCPNGVPGTLVSYTVIAHTDSSMISQAAADALARIRGQAYANTYGSCSTGPYVSTIAGDGQIGYRDGSLRSSEFGYLWRIAIDGNGNLYLPDGNLDMPDFDLYTYVRKISITNGLVSTLAGSSVSGYADSTGTKAKFNNIFGIVADLYGNVYVCDHYNYKIRKITPAGVVSTLAGSTNGYADGQGTGAKFSLLFGMGIDASGNLYAADGNNYRIRKITPGGLVSTFAGNGTSGYVDGPVSTAEFSGVDAVVVDKSGIVYISDNGRIRKISAGVVSTLAGDGTEGGFNDGTGTAAKFGYITQMVTDAAGNIYASDYPNNCIRKITPAGVVTTITTHGIGGGYLDGPISTALFNFPFGIAIDAAGNLYISDENNFVIRKITFQ